MYVIKTLVAPLCLMDLPHCWSRQRWEMCALAGNLVPPFCLTDLRLMLEQAKVGDMCTGMQDVFSRI